MTRETAANYSPEGEGYAPAQVSRRLEVQLNQQRERIIVIGEVSMAGMTVMSDVQRYAAFEVAAATAAATKEDPDGATTDREIQLRLSELYARQMAQLLHTANVMILQAVASAAEQLGKRSFVDRVAELKARLVDALSRGLKVEGYPLTGGDK